ncbi:MAG: hypothetical protein RXR31_03530 [Thermoproteota archaeon]
MEGTKIIAVVADWEESSKYIKRVVEEVSKETNTSLEIKNEDWDFLVTYGVKDEYGGVEVPQVFIQDEKDKIRFVMGRVPLDENGKPDLKKAKEILKSALQSTS